MGRIRRVRNRGIGIRRRRRGAGYSYIGTDGRPLKDPAELERIRALAIPPAWTDVWICPDADGHLQAVGTDAAGRLQYRYHPRWRANRDTQKFARIEAFAQELPAIRKAYRAALASTDASRERVLAAAVALLDEGLFRIGTEQYTKENGSFGLATIRKDQVKVTGDRALFDFTAKGGQRRLLTVSDQSVVDLIRHLKRRRAGGQELLAYKDGSGWHDVRSSDINAFLKELAGEDVTAKDFRTWHATVFAAVRLAVAEAQADAGPGRPPSPRRTMSRVTREVADALGNTPAVARNSYIDPRVFDSFEQGDTILVAIGNLPEPLDDLPFRRARIEEAVLSLLRGDRAARSAA